MDQLGLKQSQIHHAVILERWRREYFLIKNDLTQNKQISDAEYLAYWLDAKKRLNQRQPWVNALPQDNNEYISAFNEFSVQVSQGLGNLSEKLTFIYPIVSIVSGAVSIITTPIKCIYDFRLPTLDEIIRSTAGATSLVLLSILLFSGVGALGLGLISMALASINIFENWYNTKALEKQWRNLNDKARKCEKNIESLMAQVDELNRTKEFSAEQQIQLSKLTLKLRHQLDDYITSGVEIRKVHKQLTSLENIRARSVVSTMGLIFLIGALLFVIPTPVSFAGIFIMAAAAAAASIFTISTAIYHKWKHHQSTKKVSKEAAIAIQKGDYTPKTEYEKAYANIVLRQKDIEKQLPLKEQPLEENKKKKHLHAHHKRSKTRKLFDHNKQQTTKQEKNQEDNTKNQSLMP